MDAIVYTSNTGFTAEYAALLGEKTSLPVYSLSEAAKTLENGSEIIYLGWLMAGQIKGYKKAAEKYRIRALCGVGMGATGSQTDDVRRTNNIGGDIELFVLQGGFDRTKLHGIYKFMMNIVAKSARKQLAKKEDKTPDELDMLDLIQNGGNRVTLENLADVFSWFEKQ